MFDMEVDYECVRELLIEMAEDFDMLGYSKVLEDFEGSGRIGRAVQKPRDENAIRIIHVYMKSIGKELLAEEAELIEKIKKAPYLKQNPQFKEQCKSVLVAKKQLEETFQELKKCFKEPVVEKKVSSNKPSVNRTASLKALPAPSRIQRIR